MYRDELAALRARYEAMGDLAPERAEVLGTIDDHARARGLSMLDVVPRASSCGQPWKEMIGAGRARMCPRCAKTVYDVSALPRPEAEQLLGRTCARPYRRRDGTLTMGNCSEGQRGAWVKLLGTVAIVTALVWGGAAIATGTARPIDALVAASGAPTAREGGSPDDAGRSSDGRMVCLMLHFGPVPSAFRGTLGPFLEAQAEPSISLETVLEYVGPPLPSH